jgi:cob(I)alamin adenosyltransferase
MVRLTRIYTKTGDDGYTSLGDGSRVTKNDPRLNAIAAVDEANASIGVVMSLGKDQVDVEVLKALYYIQNDLFDVGADLCVPVVATPKNPPLRIAPEKVLQLESYIDLFNASLEPLNSFVLPSGTPASANLHVSRTIVRRAERAVWEAIYHYGDSVNKTTAIYLNRLSDLLFVMARFCNDNNDVLWKPGVSSGDAPLD